MATTEEVIRKELEGLIKDFKPQFGNERHIEAAKLVTLLHRYRRTLRSKINAAAAIPVWEAKVEKVERDLHYALKSSQYPKDARPDEAA